MSIQIHKNQYHFFLPKWVHQVDRIDGRHANTRMIISHVASADEDSDDFVCIEDIFETKHGKKSQLKGEERKWFDGEYMTVGLDWYLSTIQTNDDDEKKKRSACIKKNIEMYEIQGK